MEGSYRVSCIDNIGAWEDGMGGRMDEVSRCGWKGCAGGRMDGQMPGVLDGGGGMDGEKRQ